MADNREPRKVGVYDSVAHGRPWVWIVIGLIVLAIILYFLLR